METSDEVEVVMVRYGRVNGTPKNTLFTVKRDNIIYFGISRCNKKDRFVKNNGRSIAYDRAVLADEEMGDSVPDGLNVHRSGLRGACSVDKVIEMLQYFENIDESMKTNES